MFSCLYIFWNPVKKIVWYMIESSINPTLCHPLVCGPPFWCLKFNITSLLALCYMFAKSVYIWISWLNPTENPRTGQRSQSQENLALPCFIICFTLNGTIIQKMNIMLCRRGLPTKTINSKKLFIATGGVAKWSAGLWHLRFIERIWNHVMLTLLDHKRQNWKQLRELITEEWSIILKKC